MSAKVNVPDASPSAVTLTIDGRRVSALSGTYVLDAARRAGIEIPTLCDHPALEPVGACRLCLVEVTHRDWNGWSNLVTSCLYPVADGIEVKTASARVVDARRRVVALLAARCPNAPVIQDLARRYGADASRLHVDVAADDCILCGLCTRVCEAHATSAITTYGRGAAKAVGAPGDEPPSDCVGCGACASVCPTHNIPAAKTATGFTIWDRTFETAVCRVDEQRCIACGACEEACPFRVARVAFRADGSRRAVIPAEQCYGCGACAGACPTAAITQLRPHGLTVHETRAGNGAPQVTVFACPRAELGSAELPPGTRVVDVPCTARVSVPQLVSELARGKDGVLVLGRHPETCRFGAAEPKGEQRTGAAGELAELAGLGPDRIRFAQPEAGRGGPAAAVAAFVADVARHGRLPLAKAVEPAPREDLDATLTLLGAIGARLDADASSWLTARGLPRPTDGGPVLLAGALPWLDLAAGPLLAPRAPADVLRAALAVIETLGTRGTGIVAPPFSPDWNRVTGVQRASAVFTLGPGERNLLTTHAGVPAQLVDDVLRLRGHELPAPRGIVTVACDGSPDQVALVETLGYRAVDVGPDPLPVRFSWAAEERARGEARLLLAERAGATAILVTGPLALARWSMLTRRGAWRRTRVLPILGLQLAWHNIFRVPLEARSIDAPLAAAMELAEAFA